MVRYFAKIPYLALFLVSLHLSATLYAQDNSTALEEIVVTASKQEESLQQVDQAVTALVADDLRERNIESFLGLNSVAPGLTVSQNEGSRMVMTIRGVGNEANQNAIANPSVSYHMDGIYMASPTIAQTPLFDISQVEVLRGPQGSLFGQNASAGVVSVLTRRPNLDGVEGYVSLAIGNYNSRKLQGSLNLPVSENSALRLSGISDVHEGFTRNIKLAQDLDDQNSFAFRTRLTSQISEDLNVEITLQTASNDRNGPAQKGFFDTSKSRRELVQDYPSTWDLTAHLANIVVDYQVGDYLVKSLASYQTDDLFITRDNDRHDLASLPPFTILPAAYDPWNISQDTVTQELQLISPDSGNRLTWIMGFFYLKTDVDINIREYIDFGADGVFDPFTVEEVRAFEQGDYGFISNSNPQRTSRSWFVQGNLDLTESTRLVAGLRNTHDDVTSDVTNFYGRSGTEVLEISSSSLSGRLSLERDFTLSSMWYLSLVRGFKPGGSNLTFGREDVIAPIVVQPTFRQETVTMTELGVKSSWWNGRVLLNSALFRYKYNDMQYQATDPEVFEGGVNNIPSVDINGLEVEWVTQITSTLRMDLRISNLHTRIASDHFTLDNVASDQVTNALLAQGLPLFGEEIQRARANQIQNIRGNRLAKSPKWTSSLLINHNTPIGSLGQLESTLTVLRRGEFQYRVFNHAERDLVPAYTIANLNIDYQPHAVRWGLALKVLNLTDADGVNSRFTDVFGVGASSEQYIPPRRVQLEWRTNF